MVSGFAQARQTDGFGRKDVMTTLSHTRRTVTLAAALLGFTLGTPVAAAPLWFDQTGGHRIDTAFDGFESTRHESLGDVAWAVLDDHLAYPPFTVLLDEPVAAVAAFAGAGVRGSVNSLSTAPYDPDDELLGEHTAESRLWENTRRHQDYHTFLAVRTAEPLISPIELPNDSPGDLADGLLIDNAASTRQGIPEPSTNVFIAVSISLFLLRWPSIRKRART